MGRRQGDTDLETLERHMAQHEVAWAAKVIERERARWLRNTFRRRKYYTWHRPGMSLAAFQVMVNETGRSWGMAIRYRGL